MKKLGMGMMRLPLKSNDRTDVDTELVNKLVDMFLMRGFDYFDTAYVYHENKSELFVRDCIVRRYPRERFRLATKLPVSDLKTEADMKRIFEEQLENCGVSFFDYYLLHNLHSGNYPLAHKFGAFDFVRELKNRGKVLNYGFSFHDSPEYLDKILNEHPDTEFVQLQINYLDWETEGLRSKECLEVAKKHGKPVIVMEPVKGGTLASLPKEYEALLKSIRPDASIPSWAIRFAAGLDGVFMVLSGMNSIEQMDDNTNTLSPLCPLTEKELEVLEKVAAGIRNTGAVACTSCRYCTAGCPKNIPIPEYFSLYNISLFENSGGWNVQHNYYENYIRSYGKASDCTGCGRCERSCPQHLPVRELLKKVAKEFE